MSATRQAQIRKWVETRLGADAMDLHERGMRFLEEAMELAQAVGVSSASAMKIGAVVYNKPRGVAAQEVGGVGVTLLALCAASDIDMMASIDMETERIFNLPAEKFRKRQVQNAAYGIGRAPTEGTAEGK